MTDQRGWTSSSSVYLRSGAVDAWAQETAEQGRRGSQVLRQVAEVAPPEEVRRALNVSDGERVMVRRRIMLIDERPVELTDSYYPLWLAGGTALAENRKIRGGASRILAETGHSPHHVAEEVSTRMPTAEERVDLALAEGVPVLALFRLVTTDGGVPVEVSVMTMVGDGARLRYEITV